MCIEIMHIFWVSLCAIVVLHCADYFTVSMDVLLLLWLAFFCSFDHFVRFVAPLLLLLFVFAYLVHIEWICV